jgi:phytoene dehydrogenase-like protein
MARVAREAGADIRLDAGIREVIVEKDRAVGVVLDSGETIRAKYVAASVNPKLLYTRLMPSGALAPEFLARMNRWRNGSGTFRMNVALSALPSFTALPGEGDHLTAGIILAPSLGYMDRAWQDAREHGWSRAPVVEVLIPSTLDETLAPEGQHVASLFCQHVAPELPDGKSWDDHREEVADLMIATVDAFAPGFGKSVLGRQILSPLDLERQFGRRVRCSDMRTIAGRCGGFITAVPAPIPAVALPARPATTPRKRSWRITAPCSQAVDMLWTDCGRVLRMEPKSGDIPRA